MSYCKPTFSSPSTDYKRASELLCQTTIEAIVRERFGAKAYRIFRILLAKKMLEQVQVAESAMLPNKEAKEILYTLLAESFVTLQVRNTIKIAIIRASPIYIRSYIQLSL